MAKIINFKKEFLKRHPEHKQIIQSLSLEKISKLTKLMNDQYEKNLEFNINIHKTIKQQTKDLKKYYENLCKKKLISENSLLVKFYTASINYSDKVNELSSSLFLLLKKNHYISSLIILRSIAETIAIYFFLISKVEIHLKKKNWIMIQNIVDRHLYGSNVPHLYLRDLPQLKPYHVNDALEYAFKNNNKKIYKAVTSKNKNFELEFTFIKKNDYDLLSELVHPVAPFRHNIDKDFSLLHSIGNLEKFTTTELASRIMHVQIYKDLIMEASNCITVNFPLNQLTADIIDRYIKHKGEKF